MDLQEYIAFSCSQQPCNNNVPSLNLNHTPISPPFQSLYHFNSTINGSCPTFPNLQQTSNFSFQKLLNTLITQVGNNEPHGTCRGQRKKPPHKPPQEVQKFNNSQSSISKKDWSKEKDVALTKAWLYISVDSDIGNNKKNTAMWDRILQAWKDNMGANCTNVRNNNSLQCRWTKIQAVVNKFHGIDEQLERHSQSGSNSEDVTLKAMWMYKDLSNGKAFKFIHCWEILIKNPKWCTKELTKTSASDKRPFDDGNSTGNETLSNVNIDDYSVALDQVNSDGIMRPQGRKSCKDKKKKLKIENGVMDALNKLQCTLQKQINVNLVDLKLKKEHYQKEFELREQVMKKEIGLKEKNQKMKEEIERMKRQERIMSQDLSKLSTIARASYEKKQAQILKEWEFGSPFENEMVIAYSLRRI